MTSLVFITGI